MGPDTDQPNPTRDRTGGARQTVEWCEARRASLARRGNATLIVIGGLAILTVLFPLVSDGTTRLVGVVGTSLALVTATALAVSLAFSAEEFRTLARLGRTMLRVGSVDALRFWPRVAMPTPPSPRGLAQTRPNRPASAPVRMAFQSPQEYKRGAG